MSFQDTKPKSVAFLYTEIEQPKQEIRRKIYLYQKECYSGINLVNDTKNLYTENSKMLLKETKDTTK